MENTLPISVSAIESVRAQEIFSPDYLLLLPLRGSLLVRGLEDVRVEGETLLFLAPFSGRKVWLEPDSSVLQATISANYLESMIGIPKAASMVTMKDSSFLATERLVAYFDLCCNDPDATFLQKMGGCFDLLRALERDITNHTESGDKSHGRSSQFAAYLEAHFREPLQLGDLAEAFGATRCDQNGM